MLSDNNEQTQQAQNLDRDVNDLTEMEDPLENVVGAQENSLRQDDKSPNNASPMFNIFSGVAAQGTQQAEQQDLKGKPMMSGSVNQA